MYLATVGRNKYDGDGNGVSVCPQTVFNPEGGKAGLVNMSGCINCPTGVENCPQQAITVYGI